MEDTYQTRVSLVQRIRDLSDHRSWSEFYTFYRPLMIKYVCAKGVGETDADDIVQDVFINKLRAGMPKFELDKTRGRFRSWLYLVTINTLRDWARQRKGFEKLAEAVKNDSQEGKSGITCDEEFDAEHRKFILEKAMEQIKQASEKTTWECFEMRILQARPAAEIAKALGLTANAVYVNASRTLSRVRDMCAEFDEELASDRVSAR